ncbi:Protein of unknown function [Gryllus bimaculatus]|nr:Protein of unknown function [Gryllus bimaculatus]
MWASVIPGVHWGPTKGSFVCKRHLADSDVFRLHPYNLEDGTVKQIPLAHLTLRDNAVSSTFNGAASYLLKLLTKKEILPIFTIPKHPHLPSRLHLPPHPPLPLLHRFQ